MPLVAPYALPRGLAGDTIPVEQFLSGRGSTERFYLDVAAYVARNN